MELSVPLSSDLERVIVKNVSLPVSGTYWWDERHERIQLKIEIKKIGDYLIPVIENSDGISVLVPETYGSVYSLKNIGKKNCSALKSSEIIYCLNNNPCDLISIRNDSPDCNVAQDLNRFSKRLIRLEDDYDAVLSEKQWNNLAWNWRNKGLIG